MKKFWRIRGDLKRSCIEIYPVNKRTGDLFDALQLASRKRIPEDTVFEIEAGKKEFDIIHGYGFASDKFYSKEFMDILNQFTDMSKRSYKINLQGAEKEYYIIYNLPTCRWINRRELNNYWESESCRLLLGSLPPRRVVFGKRKIGPVFTPLGYNEMWVTEEIMKALKKAKLTNIEYREVYGYTPEEAVEWARENPDDADDFVNQEWFKKLLPQ